MLRRTSRKCFSSKREEWYALIIDADAEARETVRHWLIKNNWQFAEAASAGEAALLISKRPRELVFCVAGLSVCLVDEDQGLTLLGEYKGGCSATARVLITAEQREDQLLPSNLY